ncbi:MAG: ATPase, partial [Spirochaetaceae bacterium]|nr:ATPase [Spirochaetaceae bacterium]
MIVPMKKLFLVTLNSERRSAIHELRRLGVVHLTSTTRLDDSHGGGAELAVARQRVEQVTGAEQALGEFKPNKQQAANPAVGDQRILTMAAEVVSL